MSTKTISIDLEAYEKLKAARLTADESFSQVIRRAHWPSEFKTCRQLLDEISSENLYLTDRQIARLGEAQSHDQPPENRWQKTS